MELSVVRRPRRGIRTTIVSSAAVVALSACSATVAGTGARADGGFPSAGSTAAPAASSAAPSAAGAASSGSLVTLPLLHLRARFVRTPRQERIRRSTAGHTLDARTAVAGLDPITEITETEISPAFGAAQTDELLAATVEGFASASGMQIDFQDTSEFRGHAAHTATLTGAAGTGYQLLCFMTGGSRLYLVLAGTGAAYNLLTGSIHLLP